VENVKDSVQATVESVKETFNIPKQVERHPWPLFGGAVALGYFAGCMLGKSSSTAAESPAAVEQPPTRNGGGNGRSKRATATKEDRGAIGSVLQSLKELAIGTLMGVGRDMLVNAAPSNLAPDLARVMDDMTTTLGGKPLRSFEGSSEQAPGTEGVPENDESVSAEMGRPMGAARWSR